MICYVIQCICKIQTNVKNPAHFYIDFNNLPVLVSASMGRSRWGAPKRLNLVCANDLENKDLKLHFFD